MGLNMVKNYVFLLGDSRTGTTSIHHFLNALGLNSIHYYPNEAKQIENSNATHHQNWNNLKSFILTSGYNAFTDYPTRSFYRELMEWQPTAHFILSTRRSTDRWAKSMSLTFGLTGPQLSARKDLHDRQNDNIRYFANVHQVPFLDICIDDDPITIGKALSRFLGCESTASFPHLNARTKYTPGFNGVRTPPVHCPEWTISDHAKAWPIVQAPSRCDPLVQ